MAAIAISVVGRARENKKRSKEYIPKIKQRNLRAITYQSGRNKIKFNMTLNIINLYTILNIVNLYTTSVGETFYREPEPVNRIIVSRSR